MYVPPRFEQENKTEIFKIIRSAPLATLIVVVDGEPIINLIPLVFDSAQNKLVGHLARANPMWTKLGNARVTAVFNGPNAYINPNWYPKDNVPTWNYAVVQVTGVCRLIENYKDIVQCLQVLSKHMESGPEKPWKFWLPEDLRGEDVLPAKIVGFEIDIVEIKAKFKLSQHRSEDEVRGAIQGLEQDRSDESSHKVAQLMREFPRKN